MSTMVSGKSTVNVTVGRDDMSFETGKLAKQADGAVVVRPMMYVALTYDHRIIDGREAVQFLVAVKEAIEDPARLLLQV